MRVESGEARGIKTDQAAVTWNVAIDNSEVEAFVESLNACGESEINLVELVKEFVLFR